MSESIKNENTVTYREKIKIPTLPKDTDDLIHYPEMKMKKACLKNDKLIFEKENDFYDAIEAGFFLLKIPEPINLKSTDLFVNNFYKDKCNTPLAQYKGFKESILAENYQGYFDRPNDQWENYYIEENNWEKNLPSDVTAVGKQMAHTGITILKETLDKIGIPRKDWSKVTNGLTEHKGHKMLAFNHFRPEKTMRGSKLHRDSGWVTVLRSTEPGLIAMIGDTLYSITPEPGYFIINFGSSIEVLTQYMPKTVRGNIHGVVKTHKKSGKDRTSYVIFLDSDLAGMVYTFQQGKPVPVQTMQDFAVQEVSRTYDDDAFV